MPDKWGRVTGEDWMGYANQFLQMGRQIQAGKAAALQTKELADNSAVKDVAALKTETYEPGTGKTEYGPGIRAGMGGALERVEANPALTAQANMAALANKSAIEQAETEIILNENTQMVDMADKMAAQLQGEYDTIRKQNPNNPYCLASSICLVITSGSLRS